MDAKKSHKSAKKVLVCLCIENVLFDNAADGDNWGGADSGSNNKTLSEDRREIIEKYQA